jgi:hypothetical protein
MIWFKLNGIPVHLSKTHCAGVGPLRPTIQARTGGGATINGGRCSKIFLVINGLFDAYIVLNI